MIQRIQSVYLLLGSIAALAPIYIRLWIVPAMPGNPLIDTAVQVLAALTAVAAIGVIFLYGNREKQYKFTLIVQVLTLILIVSVIAVLYLRENFPGVAETTIAADALALLLLPFVAYIFFLLARRAIKKDIKKVKSMDRIR